MVEKNCEDLQNCEKEGKFEVQEHSSLESRACKALVLIELTSHGSFLPWLFLFI
jgi:hypothetical protein